MAHHKNPATLTHTHTVWTALEGYSDRYSSYYSALHKQANGGGEMEDDGVVLERKMGQFVLL